MMGILENKEELSENIYYNMTDKQKMYYVEFASKFLGLGADTTIERITPEVAAEVDEFIDVITKCSDTLSIYSVVSYFIPLGKLAGFINKIGIFSDFISRLESSVKSLRGTAYICYLAAKRNYANRVQFLFFMQ